MSESLSLWSRIVDPDNLWRAYRRARNGKRRRPDVARFSMAVESELLELREELTSGRYRPAGYRRFYVHDRKPRLISAAPFRDRVVHHALMQVVEPLFEAKFSDHSWACRQGKGTHQAVRQYQRWAQRYAYALKMDVAAYFPSIDHQRLMAKIEALVDDPKVLDLFAMINASAGGAKGLPIGNLTSQMLGNLYLDDLDHFITGALGQRAYLRYVDDMIVLGDDKEVLWRTHYDVAEFLLREGLRLHPRKVYLTPTRCGLDVLGYRVYPRFIRLRRDNGYRFRRRLKSRVQRYQEGNMTWPELDAGVQSWLGHARHAESHGLRRALFCEIVIDRGASDHAAGSRRRLEQQTAPPAGRRAQQEPRRR